MKVLVTGAAGFIGSHVVDGLKAAGAEVIGLDSLDPGVHKQAPDYLRDDVEYCFTDLRYWRPDSRFADVEAIVHLAALGGVSRALREPANVIGANVQGTIRLVEEARNWPHLKRIVLTSSFSIYGTNYQYECAACQTAGTGARRTEDLERGVYEVLCPRCGRESTVLPIRETAAAMPLEAYGASKYMQELCFRGFDHCRLQVLRFSSVYGQRLRLHDGEATIIARLAAWIHAGERPRLFEDGRQIRDWVFVGDIVDTIKAVLQTDQVPPVINICTGQPVRLVEACHLLAAAMELVCDPEILGGYRPGDMRHCLGDATEFSKVIGRAPISLMDGARIAFSELRSNIPLASR